MDRPDRGNGAVQTHDADLPVPLTEDLQGAHIYEELEGIPENAGAHVHESSFAGFTLQSEPQAGPPARVGAGVTHTNGPPPPPRRPCLPGRRAHEAPPVPPRTRVPLRKQFSCDLTGPAQKLSRSRTEIDTDEPWSIRLIDAPQGSTSRLSSFCRATSELMARYGHTDSVHNSGVVWGRLSQIHPALLQQVEVTVSVALGWDNHQLPFPTAVDRTVKSLIDEIVRLLELHPATSGHHVLKLCDSEEYLRNEELLGMHDTIQIYSKFKLVVPLRLLHVNSLQHRLARGEADDRSPCQLYQFLRPACVFDTCRLSLQDVLSGYNREVTELMKTKSGVNINVLVDHVYTISNLLCGFSCVELEDVISWLNRLGPSHLSHDETESAVIMLRGALLKVLQTFFDNFQSGFRGQEVTANLQTRDVEYNNEICQFNTAALYKLPLAWLDTYEYFSVSCELTCGGVKICDTGVSENISTALRFGNKIQCNRMMVFPVRVKELPYESMLTFHLKGSKKGKSPELLGWAVLPLYSHRTFVTGTVLLGVSTLVGMPAPPSPALFDSHTQPVGVLLQLEFQRQFKWTHQRPVALRGSVVFTEPCEELQGRMLEVSKKHCLCFLTENEKTFLWAKRHCGDKGSTFLHLLLGGVRLWLPEYLTEIYTILDNWPIQLPEEALFLLGDSFHDQTVRRAAVQYFEQIPDGELEVFLPQLVQALKSEWELDGPLVMLLLERSLKSIRIAQQLYWLLDDAHSDPFYQSWHSKIQAALRHCCGQKLRQELERQTHLVSMLVQVADKVRTADKARRKVCKRISVFTHSLAHDAPLSVTVQSLTYVVLEHVQQCQKGGCCTSYVLDSVSRPLLDLLANHGGHIQE